MNDIDIINMIKGLGIDMIHEARSGHPGIVLSAAPIIYTLYKNYLNVNTSDPNWINRDRFVMSAGHGSALLYATLFTAGYSLTIDDLKKFRRAGSRTPGHPERGVTPGVDVSTGPLGQGIANAVGIALGERILKERYRYGNNKSVIDYKVYCLVGDGDLMEGVSYEAASLAGTLKLNNLIVLYDSNNISLDGPTSKTFTENVCARFEAMGWSTIQVKEAKVSEIDKALSRAQKANVPTLIEVKTKIGEGSLLEGTNEAHGKPLEQKDIEQLKMKLGLPLEPFYVNKLAYDNMRMHISKRVNAKYIEWSNNYKEYVSANHGDDTVAKYLFNNNFNYDVFKLNWEVKGNEKAALRDSNIQAMQKLNTNIKTFVGGSADVGTTTKTYQKNFQDIGPNKFDGSNIWFGVREHAMGSILNGLAISGLKPYGSAFLSFADYMKPAMRMAAIMNLPVTYIFTHDSISIGPDGPTHQPIEQLTMLRSIPNMKVYRPADMKELIGCWQSIINSNTNPSALILSRNEVDLIPESDAFSANMGGYILKQEKAPLKLILMATGTEVGVANAIYKEYADIGELGIRIVSMPCMEKFLEQDKEYQEKVLPKGVIKIAIEAGSPMCWDKFTSYKYVIGLEKYGISGTKNEVLEYMEFDLKAIKQRLSNILKQR